MYLGKSYKVARNYSWVPNKHPPAYYFKKSPTHPPTANLIFPNVPTHPLINVPPFVWDLKVLEKQLVQNLALTLSHVLINFVKNELLRK